MTYAIIDTTTNKIMKDAQGYPHSYSTKAQADSICADLVKNGTRCEVRPV